MSGGCKIHVFYRYLVKSFRNVPTSSQSTSRCNEKMKTESLYSLTYGWCLSGGGAGRPLVYIHSTTVGYIGLAHSAEPYDMNIQRGRTKKTKPTSFQHSVIKPQLNSVVSGTAI